MPDDNAIVGFTEPVAQALVASIRVEEQTFVQGRVRVANGVSVSLFRFAMTSGWSSGSASATIKTMGGTTVETSTIGDPEGIFAGLSSGDTGLCIKQSGAYFIIQANCPA